MNYTVMILPPAQEFLDSLQPKLEAKAYRTIELLKTFGYKLTEPHSKKLVDADGLKELRIKVGTDICAYSTFTTKGPCMSRHRDILKKKLKPIAVKLNGQ